MTFVTGSVTSSNPGPALYAALEPTLLAVGYTLEDTVVIGARTHKILKSASGLNSFGRQYFLDINYPTTGIATGLMMATFENYTAATDQALRGPYTASSTTAPDPVTFSRFGDTSYALETNWNNGASATALHLGLATAAITYWASVTPERVVLMISSAPTKMAYAGFFTPNAEHAAHAADALYPLITLVLTAGTESTTSTNPSSASAVVTRLPRLAAFDSSAGSVAPANWNVTVWVSPLGLLGRAGSGGAVGGTVSPFTGTVSIFPIPVAFGTSSPNSTQPAAARVGDLDGVASGYVAPTVSRGDTVTVSGDKWYLSSLGGTANALFMQEK